MNERIVLSGTSALAVYERGEPGPDRPTVVLAHGWPDNAELWAPVAQRLADRYHVVTYDMRGTGRSTPAVAHRPYRLALLADDVDAVIAAVSPDRPVHLVGHDWGSVVGWEYVGDPERDLSSRVVSFTSVSGPCLDHLGLSVRRRLRRPTPANVGPVLAQLAKSGYTVVLQLPVVRSMLWRLGFARVFRPWLRRTEGVEPAPTVAKDAIAAVGIYRQNIGPKLARPVERRTDLPVRLVVNRKDLYVTHRLYADVVQWAPNLTRHDLDAGHWSPRSHPDELAAVISSHVDATEKQR